MKWRKPALIVALAVLALTACTTYRPTENIRESGDLFFQRGEYAAAASEYELIIERYPGDWEAQYKLGLSLLELDRPDEARQALEVAHTRKPGNPDIADALAEAMYAQGRENELYAFLRERAQSTQSVHAHLRLARYATELNDPDSAQLALDTAIEIDEGQSVEPYLQAADFAIRLGDIERALRRLRQAYGIDPYDDRVKQRLRDLGEVPGPSIVLPPGR
jgi:tetratricopeptide (TPR) repeat protein